MNSKYNKNIFLSIALIVVFFVSYYLFSKINGTMVSSVFVGVSIFVTGQFILKLCLDPIVAFKEKLGELSALFLLHQATIISGNFTKEVQADLRRLSSAIKAKKQAVTGYDFFATILCLPSSKDVTEGCQSLNLIAYQTDEISSNSSNISKAQKIIYERMKDINQRLKVVVEYN